MGDRRWLGGTQLAVVKASLLGGDGSHMRKWPSRSSGQAGPPASLPLDTGSSLHHLCFESIIPRITSSNGSHYRGSNAGSGQFTKDLAMITPSASSPTAPPLAHSGPGPVAFLLFFLYGQVHSISGALFALLPLPTVFSWLTPSDCLELRLNITSLNIPFLATHS